MRRTTARGGTAVVLALAALVRTPVATAKDDPVKVSDRVRDAIRAYLEAPIEKDEPALKTALSALGGDLAVALAALRTHAPLTKLSPGAHHGRTFRSGGHEWTYSIRLPKAYDGKTRLPVLVLPDHESISGEEGLSSWEQDARVEDLVLFRPEITRVREDQARFPDQGFFARDQAMARVMADALAHLRLHYAVDPDRFVMTGLSQAGYYTWYYAVTFPDDFAGIVPESAGGLAVRVAVLPLAKNLTGLAVRILHAEGDRTVPYADAVAMRDAIEAAGGKPELITYRDSDWDGSPPPSRHPGPYPLRLKHVLEWATKQRRTLPDAIDRVVRYDAQRIQGWFRVVPPQEVGRMYTVRAAVVWAKDGRSGVIGSNRDDSSFLLFLRAFEPTRTSRLSNGMEIDSPGRHPLPRLSFGTKLLPVLPDVRLLLSTYKALGDRARLAVAEVPL